MPSCEACGHANPDGAKFCNACGARLNATTAPARDLLSYTPRHLVERILASRAQMQGERKEVTVLFADVKGSMDLAESVDPEEWHRIMDRFFTILTEGVHRFEGTINQYGGDGIMALFGAPLAHEDHAQRACHAALYLRDALRAYAQELRRRRGLDLAVRIGLNSGAVVVGTIGDDLRMDYTAQGHTVGLAARMEQIAEAGRVYLSEATAALVAGYFRLEDLGNFMNGRLRSRVPVRRRCWRRLLTIAFFASTAALFLGRSTSAHADAESLHQQALRAADSLRRRQKPWGILGHCRDAVDGLSVADLRGECFHDLLEPIADETGLSDVVENAREYLQMQIEPTGLVRYHGKPDTGGNLPHGCELPPDSDDTALVWRIAPRDSADLLAAARQTLRGNRDAGGLYRIWIADANEYRCFYDEFFPRDSNPADVCIQMHVYLFLKAEPPLLYHNALSAEPPHYHWSEDFGYALWLRLFVESERRSPHPPLPSSATR